jgi:nitrogen fixation NifU-like protein
MAYSDKVVEHYNNPRNVGSLPKEDPNVGTGLVGAPECGDVMKLQMKINPDTQVIEEAKFKKKRFPSRTRTSCVSSRSRR